MPVGTRGSVKGILPELVRATGAQIVLNNTYHLMLRPGSELIQKMGGVHRFMNWPGPILTDSGGYQAYSLSDMNKVDDDGVTFKSIIDGSNVRLTPERAMQVQNELGPDIMMAFDDCPPSAAEAEDGDKRLVRALARDRVQTEDAGRQAGSARDTELAKKKNTLTHAQRLELANHRTIRWLERCKAAHARPDVQALFGIIQGGTDLAQRSWCVERVCNIELPGYAIGGVAVGESPDAIATVVRHTAPLMPDAKPRYLMGVGYERDLLIAVRAGVDMFDCVLPTRNGRNANAFTRTGQIRLRNAQYQLDQLPIEPGCDCLACDPARHGHATPDGQPFTRGYLRHLFMAGEMLGPILVSLHNLRHFQRFMADVRQTIQSDDWAGLLARYPVAA
jgi:queuine tRNA-ribosyltransferase